MCLKPSLFCYCACHAKTVFYALYMKDSVHGNKFSDWVNHTTRLWINNNNHDKVYLFIGNMHLATVANVNHIHLFSLFNRTFSMQNFILLNCVCIKRCNGYFKGLKLSLCIVLYITITYIIGKHLCTCTVIMCALFNPMYRSIQKLRDTLFK